VAYLIEVLVTMARELETQLADMSPAERAAHERAVRRLTAPSAALPDFSGFHPAFRSSVVGEGDVRAAFFRAFADGVSEYVPLADAAAALEAGRPLVSTRFVVPYPPGFPILVPGQLVSPQIVEFMRKLDVKEVHGYRPDRGLAVFTAEALERSAGEPAATVTARIPPEARTELH